MSNQNGRRNFLKSVGIAGGAVIAAPIFKAWAESCGLTPAQTAGPFYPGEENFSHDNDLTYIQGHGEKALGQVIYIE